MEGSPAVPLPPSGDVPGAPKPVGAVVLEKASQALQSRVPQKQVCQHLCALHFASSDMRRQVETHHYCGHVNENVLQCLLYDGEGADAKLIGLEYMVTEDVFQKLPDEEKRLWHSHEYEIRSGMLTMPRVPETLEVQHLKAVAKTYGKVWQFWQVDLGDGLPTGPPALMTSFTEDGQMSYAAARTFEDHSGISLGDSERRRKRAEIPTYVKGIDPHVDSWKSGKGFVVKAEER